MSKPVSLELLLLMCSDNDNGVVLFQVSSLVSDLHGVCQLAWYEDLIKFYFLLTKQHQTDFL